MYQLEANIEFKQRTKTVFDTLLLIESNHNDKKMTYNEMTNDPDESILKEPVSEITDSFRYLNDPKEPVFKMPRTVRRPIFKSKRPDYEKYPEKWKKYSLEGVKEFGNGANYAAAMEFLKTKNKIIEKDEPMETIQFNKPLSNKKKKFESTTESKPAENIDESNSLEKHDQNLNSFKIKKRSQKNLSQRNIRKRNDDKDDHDCGNVIESRN